tara:strand:+ start:1677 stop:2399 length:723 start_codon:yes stop_codon:yes gene_type:complete
MKLTNNHIIIILVCVLVFSAISGPSIEEGMQNISSTKNMDTRKKWRGENLNEQKCINIPGAKYIKNMNKHNKRIYKVEGCDTTKSCCVPHSEKPGNKNRRQRRDQRRDQRRQERRDMRNNYSDSDSDSDSDYDSDSQNDIYNNNMVNTVSMPYQPPQPEGIYASQIPRGEEDKYILKSEIVPPVCPACPPVLKCPTAKKETPCPPCARCPEPSFECKKVPTYKKSNEFLPVPMLNDFSQF